MIAPLPPVFVWAYAPRNGISAGFQHDQAIMGSHKVATAGRPEVHVLANVNEPLARGDNTTAGAGLHAQALDPEDRIIIHGQGVAAGAVQNGLRRTGARKVIAAAASTGRPSKCIMSPWP